MGVSLLLNVLALGVYKGLIAAFLYLSAGLFVTAFFAFCAGAVGCLLAGTLFEAAFFGAALLAIPYTVTYAIGVFLKHLLWGNPFGARPYLGDIPAAPSVTSAFSAADPALFFYNDLNAHRMFYRPLDTDTPAAILPGPLLIWAGICVLIVLAGLFLARRRKAEQAGFAGKNAGAARFFLFIPTLFAGALVFDLSAGVNLAFGLAALIAVFALCLFGGDRALLGARAFSVFAAASGSGSASSASVSVSAFSSARKVALALGVRVLILVIMAAGAGTCYGVYAALPAQEEVASVSVSYVGSPSYVGVPSLGSSTENSYYISAKYDYADAAAIASSLSAHEQIDAAGKRPLAGNAERFEDTALPYDVSFTYTYKDGKTQTWYYDRASFAQLRALLALEDTQAVRNGISAVFPEDTGSSAGSTADGAGAAVGGESLWARNAFASGEVILTEPTFREMYAIGLAENDRAALLGCIKADVLAQPAADRYFPKGEPLGILMFTFDSENDRNSFSYHLNNTFVYLDEGFTQTLAFLKDKDLWLEEEGGSAGADEIETLILQSYDPYIGINKPSFPQSLYFMSYTSLNNDDFRIQKDFGKVGEVRDPAEVKRIAAELRSNYFLSEPGNLAAVKYKGSDKWVYKFWPTEGIDTTTMATMEGDEG
jgi:ABC-2 type transport system permease protein